MAKQSNGLADEDLELVEAGDYKSYSNNDDDGVNTNGQQGNGSPVSQVPPLSLKEAAGDTAPDDKDIGKTDGGDQKAESVKPSGKTVSERPPKYTYKFLGVPNYWRSKLYVKLTNETPWSVFIALTVCLITLINTTFALVLYSAGGCCGDVDQDFSSQFYFSYQTFSTIGYGRVAPVGTFANIVAYTISLSSYVTQTIVTGLILAKFFKPKQCLRWSQKVFIHCRDTAQGRLNHLVLRVNNDLGTNRPILHAQAQVFAFMYVKVEGKRFRRTYQLNLVTKEWPEFYTPWTIMHCIDQDSPLYGMDEQALTTAAATFTVVLTGLDTAFSNTISSVKTYNVLPGEYSDLRWSKCPGDVIDVNGYVLTLRTADWDTENDGEVVPMDDPVAVS